MEMVLNLMEESPYEVILMGDFNNTAYSYIYRELRSHGLNDAYKEAGNGFGKTFDLKFLPLRIDFILPQESLEIIDFESYDVPYSDHYPITATLGLD